MGITTDLVGTWLLWKKHFVPAVRKPPHHDPSPAAVLAPLPGAPGSGMQKLGSGQAPVHRGRHPGHPGRKDLFPAALGHHHPLPHTSDLS